MFRVDNREIPIVHRVLRIHRNHTNDVVRHPESAWDADGGVEVLSKGDNNYIDDRGLYAEGQMYLAPKHILGKGLGYVPALGMVTIVVNDYPWLKYVGLAVFAGYVVLTQGRK